jgi:PKD repeat protein
MLRKFTFSSFLCFLTVVLNAQYCVPTYTNQNGDDFINGFELNNVVNNNSGNSGVDGYIDYSQTLPAIELVMGTQYEMFYTGGIYNSDKYRVWIDYNHDNDFNDANEAVANGTTSLSYQTIQLQFTVPAGILSGVTRLRIRCAYSLSNLIDPCANYTWGETEDYAVNISPPSGIYCIPADIGMDGMPGSLASSLSFGNISSNFNFPTPPYYHNYTSSISTTASLGEDIVGNFVFGSITFCTYMLWIDWNHDALFSTSEMVQSLTNTTSNQNNIFIVTVPNTALTGNTRVRIRIQANGLGMDPCFSPGKGFAEDYSINITGASGSAPIAAFSASSLTVNAGSSVNFTDLSSGSPTSWAWTFTGSSTSTSTLQNPSNITYNNPGCYAVSLTCSNTNGSDSETQQCYINVLGQQEACNELFFSEYIEGSGNDKAIEIYNPNTVDLDLAGYSIKLYANGSSIANNTLDLVGILGAQSSTVIASPNASSSILGVADQASTICSFNGDDALVLTKNSVPIDVIGQVGSDPGTYWPVGSGSTLDHTLVRNASVNGPSSDWNVAQTQWTSYAIGTLTFLANHDSNCESGSLGGYSLNDENGQPLFWWNAQVSLLNWRNIPVEFLNHSAYIYDLKGAIVCQFNVNSESSSVGLPILTNGVYLVRIASESDYITQKLVLRSAE